MERKTTMKRRLLSILLLICMTLTLFPVPAFAEEDTEEAPVSVCNEACTEGDVNYACPVCSAEGVQACTCEEEVIVVNAVEDADDAGDAGNAGDADAADDADDADDVAAADNAGDMDTAAYSTYAADAPAAQEAVTPVLTPPTIEGTFYALDKYSALKAGLTGGTATVNGEKIEGIFALDEDELLYGYRATDDSQLKAGTLTRKVIFTPADTAKYTTETCTVTVTVHLLKAIRISSSYEPITDKPVGTEFDKLGLRDEIEFEAGRGDSSIAGEYPGDVIWDERTYDKNSPYEQTITGTLDLSWWKEYIVQPTKPLTTSIKVKLKYEPVAPTIVTEPVFKWRKGEFALDDNQIFVDDYLKLGTDENSGGTGELSGGEAKIGETAIDGTFTLKQSQQSFDSEGQYDVAVVFTPIDQDRYAVTECTIKIDAIKRTVARIEACQDITDKPVGTAFDDLGLPFVNLYTEDDAVYPCGATWDKTTYDPYSIEEQTITGTPNLDWRVKQPAQEIKAEVKVELKTTSDTIEIYYHIYSPDGRSEYEAAGGGAILTDHTTALEDYELRGLGAIFQALQAAGKFKGLDEAGNELDGWYKTRDINDYSFKNKATDSSQLTVTGNRVDLYGKINPKTIMVTLDPCGGTLSAGESPVECMYGVSYGNLPMPERHGYTFDGWYTAETGGSEISKQVEVMETTDHTIYAHWKQAAGHSPVRAMNSETLKTPADCEHDAVYYMSCSCGVISTSETFTAENTAGHDYINCKSNGNGTHAGVCSRDNIPGTEPCSGGTAYCYKKATCKKCNTEYGSYGGHIYGADWSNDNTYHWHECSGCNGVDSMVPHADNNNDHRCDACYHLLSDCADSNNDHKCDVCGKQLSECADNDNDHLCDICSKKLTDHTGGTASCVKKAVCDTCGKEYGELASHSFTAENTDAKYLETAASCTAKAVYYKSCAVCGAIGTETFEYGEKDPDNHSGTGGWSITASTHEQKWSCCGKVTVSAEGHSFGEWVVTKSPTYSQRGIRTHTCELCGYEESEYIPATGGGKTPRTGDDSALGLWSLLMCTSLTGALSLTMLGLKRRTKKEQ